MIKILSWFHTDSNQYSKSIRKIHDMLNNVNTVTTLIPIDYHMHSTNSYDCRASMADMCRSALQKGVAEIAFTEHFNNKPEDLGFNKYDPERYFRDLEACRAEFEPL